MNETLALLNIFPGHIYAKDVNGLYLVTNATFLKTIQLSCPAELIGQDDKFAVGLEFADDLMDNDRFVMCKRADLSIVERGPSATGKGIEYFTKKMPIYDDIGNVLGVLGYSHPITKKNFKLGEIIVESLNTVTELCSQNYKELSVRQIECLYYLLRGMSNKEIGALLQISSRTVESYLEQVKIKLRCLNTSDLIRKIFHVGQIALNQIRIK